MDNQQMIAVLRGTREQKLALFNDFLNRAALGIPLEENEVSVFETLKKELIVSESKVVQLEASLSGNSNAGVG